MVLKDPELVNTELQRFLDVTPQDIQRVARKYFVPENKTVVEVYPKKDAGEKAASSIGNEASDESAGEAGKSKATVRTARVKMQKC